MGCDSVACSSCFLRDSEASSWSTYGKKEREVGRKREGERDGPDRCKSSNATTSGEGGGGGGGVGAPCDARLAFFKVFFLMQTKQNTTDLWVIALADGWDHS